jgi:hypothetical protein
MLVQKYTFIRPTTSVAFYSSSNNTSVKAALIAARRAGDIISVDDVMSLDGLTLTRTTTFPGQEAFDRVSSNTVFAENKQVRTAYNIDNGITELSELTVNL